MDNQSLSSPQSDQQRQTGGQDERIWTTKRVTSIRMRAWQEILPNPSHLGTQLHHGRRLYAVTFKSAVRAERKPTIRGGQAVALPTLLGIPSLAKRKLTLIFAPSASTLIRASTGVRKHLSVNDFSELPQHQCHVLTGQKGRGCEQLCDCLPMNGSGGWRQAWHSGRCQRRGCSGERRLGPVKGMLDSAAGPHGAEPTRS